MDSSSCEFNPCLLSSSKYISSLFGADKYISQLSETPSSFVFNASPLSLQLDAIGPGSTQAQLLTQICVLHLSRWAQPQHWAGFRFVAVKRTFQWRSSNTVPVRRIPVIDSLLDRLRTRWGKQLIEH
ncbi:hypothetical protein WN943_022124 [Citrus x changshan-huyou]